MSFKTDLQKEVIKLHSEYEAEWKKHNDPERSHIPTFVVDALKIEYKKGLWLGAARIQDAYLKAEAKGRL
jgi:hypothetical protein